MTAMSADIPPKPRRRRRPDHQLKPLWPGNVPPPHVAARLAEVGMRLPAASLAQDVSMDAEGLPAAGSAPAQGAPTPNPSHPVRSHIMAPTWRQVTASAAPGFCVCGMQLPLKRPERCESCGRPIQEKG